VKTGLTRDLSLLFKTLFLSTKESGIQQIRVTSVQTIVDLAARELAKLGRAHGHARAVVVSCNNVNSSLLLLLLNLLLLLLLLSLLHLLVLGIYLLFLYLQSLRLHRSLLLLHLGQVELGLILGNSGVLLGLNQLLSGLSALGLQPRVLCIRLFERCLLLNLKLLSQVFSRLGKHLVVLGLLSLSALGFGFFASLFLSKLLFSSFRLGSSLLSLELLLHNLSLSISGGSSLVCLGSSSLVLHVCLGSGDLFLVVKLCILCFLLHCGLLRLSSLPLSTFGSFLASPLDLVLISLLGSLTFSTSSFLGLGLGHLDLLCLRLAVLADLLALLGRLTGLSLALFGGLATATADRDLSTVGLAALRLL